MPTFSIASALLLTILKVGLPQQLKVSRTAEYFSKNSEMHTLFHAHLTFGGKNQHIKVHIAKLFKYQTL